MVVTVPASSGPDETCFDIDIIDDSIFEYDEEFLVNFQIAPGSNAQIGTVDSTCVRIIDDDDGTNDTYHLYTYLLTDTLARLYACTYRNF